MRNKPLHAALRAVLLTTTLLAAATPMAFAQEPQAAASPAANQQVVDGLLFTVTGLRLPPFDAQQRHTATVNLSIVNQTDKPVSLVYNDRTALMVNDIGYRWTPRHGAAGAKGIPVYQKNSNKGVSLDGLIPPGGELRAVISVYYLPKRGQTLGNSYDFTAEFSSWVDEGEGRVRLVKNHGISLTGLSPGGGGNNSLGKALGGLFGG